MATFIQVWFCQMHHYSSWLRELAACCRCAQHLPSHVRKHIENVAIWTFSQIEAFYAPLDGFVWHILLCYKATTKVQHCFINSNFMARCVVFLIFFCIFSRNRCTLSIWRTGPVAWLTWSIQNIISNWSRDITREKKGTSATYDVLQ